MLGRSQPTNNFQTVELGDSDIQYHNIRHMFPCKLQRIDTVISLGNDLITMTLH